MTLHTDLLHQARHLATKEPRKPSQASLRRSVSASYYALFHRLVDEAARRMVSGPGRDGIRRSLSRAFRHHDMKRLCTSIAGGTPLQKIAVAFQPLPLDPRLVHIARAFADLQDARHSADYDTHQTFTRQDALHFHQLASTSLSNWAAIRRTPQADAFLAGLLINQRIHG